MWAIAITFFLLGVAMMAGLAYGMPLWRNARDMRKHWGMELDGNNKVVRLGRRWE